MRRIIVLSLLCVSAAGAFAQPAPGIYRLLNFEIDVEGKKDLEYFGKSPRGSIVLTHSYFISVLTAGDRLPGRSVEAKAAQLDSLIAYAGPYRIERDRMYVDVESAWVESWRGTTQARTWRVEGTRLTLVTDRAPYSRDPAKTATATLVFEKVD